MAGSGIRQFVADHPNEVDRIAHLNLNCRILFRIRDAASTYGAGESDFRAWLAAGLLRPGTVHGIAFDVRPNRDHHRVTSLVAMSCSLAACLGLSECWVLNAGGNYRLPDEVPSEYYREVNAAFRAAAVKHRVSLQVEIGRSVVKHAGTLVTEILDARPDGNAIGVWIDAGEQCGVSHGPTRIDPEGVTTAGCVNANFYGPTCSRKLLFSAQLDFQPRPGLRLRLRGMGSYTICMQSDFHSWERTPVRISNNC
jgi:diaminopimelate decarboxylase